MNIIFLGAPGAGKGTQAEIVSEKLGIPTISTGAIIREAIKNKTPMGMSAQTAIEKGELVSDDVVIGIIQDRVAMDDCKGGFILDGFPRTIAQAEALEKMGVVIDKVVNIYVSDEEIIQRMSGRRVCSSCGTSYHTLFKPTKDNKTCDKCSSELTIRKDDAPEVVKSRLVVYHEQTAPLEEFYQNKNLLVTVKGQEELADTTKLTLEALNIK